MQVWLEVAVLGGGWMWRWWEWLVVKLVGGGTSSMFGGECG